MAIPVLNKEEIFSIKDINTLQTARNINGVEFDNLIAQLNIDAQGFVQGMILQNYHEYITDAAWRNCIKLYCQWQSFTQGYSEIFQTLSNNSYVQLVAFLAQMDKNFTLQARQEVTPNKSKNFKVVNS